MVKLKATHRKKISNGTLLLPICVVPLVLIAWGSTNNVTKANALRVTNQTTSFQVVRAEIVGDTLYLNLKNISEKTINGYTLYFNRTQIQNDFTIGNHSIAPGQIEETTLPYTANELSPEIEVQAAVFTDGSYNGSITAANTIRDKREGLKTQLQAVRGLLDKALQFSDTKLPANMGQLAAQVASLPEGDGRGTKGRAVRFGLRDAKVDVQKMLQNVINESGRERNLDLRQRLVELRNQVTERVNRL